LFDGSRSYPGIAAGLSPSNRAPFIDHITCFDNCIDEVKALIPGIVTQRA
jgi:hypothetical protein